MNSIELKIGNKLLKDGSTFRVGSKKYTVNFNESGDEYNIDLWDHQTTKLLPTQGTIKINGASSYSPDILSHIDEVLENH